MKHALIVTHPNPNSFTLAMAETYRKAALACGHDVAFRDLYRTGFDPRLAARELPGAADFAAGDDVSAERALIADARVFAFVYPLWFNAPPAMLKGYLERVFGLGFAYAHSGLGTESLLRGRMMVSITSSGAPMEWVRRTGSWDAMRKLFDEHFASVCGLSVVEHLHFGEITTNITAEAFQTCAAAVADLVDRRFARPA